MTKIKPHKKTRIGLYSMGLEHYWGQFDGLKQRLLDYGTFIAGKMEREYEVDVCYFGMVDCEDAGREAGAFFQKQQVGMIFAHSATYVTSASILPLHQICQVPVILLNLQPTARINYERTTTGEWLAHCGACPVPEISNAFHRAGISCHIINGLLGLEQTPEISMTDEVTAHLPEARKAWNEIGEWLQAAAVKDALRYARFGFLGNTYSGMLDMYSDFTMFQGQTGASLQVLEMCDLDRLLKTVTDAEIARKQSEITSFFVIGDGHAADPLAGVPKKEDLLWSAKVAAAQEKLVDEFGLDALTYYYHGAPDNEYEKLQSGFIVGHSLLTANGIPCAGEGDLKTCLAMKICDLAGIGGSFCEIVVTDYLSGTILMGHDGPFHLKIAKGKPTLRGMGLYHGKQGSGISVEAKVKSGPITNLGCTQTAEGRLKFIAAEAQAVDGPIMTIGNTQTPVQFREHPDRYMDRWFQEAPTHHFAMSIGHNVSLFRKIALLLQIELVEI